MLSMSECEHLVRILLMKLASLEEIESEFRKNFAGLSLLAAFSHIEVLVREQLLDKPSSVVAFWLLTSDKTPDPSRHQKIKELFEQSWLVSCKEIENGYFSESGRMQLGQLTPELIIRVGNLKMPLVPVSSLSGRYIIDTNQSEPITHTFEEILLEVIKDRFFGSSFEHILLRPIPPIHPVSETERREHFIPCSDIPMHIFDVSVSDISIEALLMRGTRRELSNEEIEFIIHGLSNNPCDADCIIHNKENAERFIRENHKFSCKLFPLLSNESDYEMLDVLNSIPFTAHVANVIMNVIMEGKAPRFFAEQTIESVMQKIRCIKDKSTAIRTTALFLEVAYDLIDSSIEMGPVIFLELQEFCGEYPAKNLSSSQKLLRLLSGSV